MFVNGLELEVKVSAGWHVSVMVLAGARKDLLHCYRLREASLVPTRTYIRAGAKD